VMVVFQMLLYHHMLPAHSADQVSIHSTLRNT
jgi:hypothetical protein